MIRRDIRNRRASPQHSGGGPPPGFDPNDAAAWGLPLWGLRSDVAGSMFTTQFGGVVAGNGDPVARWEDQTVNGRHFSTSGPTCTKDNAGIGGLPSVDFAASELFSPAFAINQPCTIYCVCSIFNFGTIALLVGQTTMAIQVYSTALANIASYSGASNILSIADHSTNHAYCFVFDGASSTIRQDALEQVGDVGVLDEPSGLILGGYQAGLYQIDGQVSWFWGYGVAHSPSQRDAYMAALAALFGTP